MCVFVCARHFSNTFAGLNSHSIAKVVQQFSVIERVYRKNRRQQQRRQRRRAASCVRCPSGHWTFGKSLQLMPQFTLRLKGFTANSTSNTAGWGWRWRGSSRKLLTVRFPLTTVTAAFMQQSHRRTHRHIRFIICFMCNKHICSCIYVCITIQIPFFMLETNKIPLTICCGQNT